MEDRMDQATQAKEALRRLYNNRARTFDCSPGHGIHSEEEKLTWKGILSKALYDKQGLKVLDAGTGTGAMALLLAEMGHEVTGIDLSERMLQRAKGKAEKGGISVEFRLGDAEALTFGDDSFDVVVARHLLWGLPSPERALAEWRRVLRVGGKVVTIDGNWNRQRPLSKEVWRYLAMPLVVVTEWRDPRRQQHKKLDRLLPLRYKKRPDAEVGLLQSLGFEVDVVEVELPRKYTLLNYLKYGYSKNNRQFVVRGIKK